jgi:cell fate (sporulation/competence/biofilm development) regulator YmcA (YheA/YmcA/DUF963 family)
MNTEKRVFTAEEITQIEAKINRLHRASLNYDEYGKVSEANWCLRKINELEIMLGRTPTPFAI